MWGSDDRPQKSLRVTAAVWTARTVLVLAGAASGTWMVSTVPVDLIKFSRGGVAILSGRWDQVYTSDWYQAGPFELIAAAMLLPLRAHRQAAWATHWDDMFWWRAAAGGVIVAGILVLVAVTRSWCNLAPSPAAGLLAAVVGIGLDLPTAPWRGGHLAQLAICLLWLWAAALARDGHPARAGLLIGMSAGWEPWGVLGVPLVLLSTSSRRQLIGASVSGVAAVAWYLPFALAAPFRMFDFQWQILPNTLISVVFPQLTTFGWPMRVGQAVLAVLAGALAVRAARDIPDVIWLAPAAIVMSRLVLDPMVLSYYAQPIAVYVVVGFGLLRLPKDWPSVVGCLTILLGYLHFRPWVQHTPAASFAGAVGVAEVVLPVVILAAMIRFRVFARDDPEVRGGPDTSRRAPTAVALRSR